MPPVDPRLSAGTRLAKALRKLPEKKDDKNPVVINQTPFLQPSQVSPEVASQPIEQQTLAQPGGFLSGGSAQPQQPSTGDQLLGAGLNALTSQGLDKIGSSLGLDKFTGGGLIDTLSGLSSIGFNTGPAIGTAAGNAAAASAATAAGAASPIGGPLAAAPVAGTFGGAGAFVSPFLGASGFAFPVAAAALPVAMSIAKKLQGSPPSTTSIIGFDDRGRAAVTDADAKGDLTSKDAELFGRRAITQLDRIRRDLGGEFNTDVGDFAVLDSSAQGFGVFDKGRLQKNLGGVSGRFKDQDDAFKAFSLIALREGAINAPQDKIDAKIKELASVFDRERTVAENKAPDIGAANNFQQFRPPLSLFQEALAETGDPASLLTRQTQPVELIANPNFVGGPNDLEPRMIPKENPFLGRQPASISPFLSASPL